MSNEIKTYLIEDHRVSGITDEILVGVKKSVSTSTMNKYVLESNSKTSAMFNIKVPSENTLVDRNIRINGTLQLNVALQTQAAAVQIAEFPSSFPLNTAINNCIVGINNTKVNAATQDISEVLKKQYSQKFLSEHVQTTPSYVDKYFGNVDQAGSDTSAGTYMGGILQAEKDSDTVGRADSKYTYKLVPDAGNVAPYNVDIVANAVDGTVKLPASPNGQGAVPQNYTLYVTMDVSEPLLGVPCFEMKSEEAAFVGVNQIDITLLFNDFSRVMYCNQATRLAIGTNKWLVGGTGANSDVFLTADSAVNVNYLSLHASDYAKMSVKNVIPYNEYVNNKTPFLKSTTFAGGNPQFQTLGTQIQMRQIPDKIYITVTPQYSEKVANASNHISYPIKNVKINFNNRMNLLGELDQSDLYVLSRRNGNHQIYSEFCGTSRSGNGEVYQSLGSIVVIDPVRDLSLDDYLSSGSIGSFTFQVDLTCDDIDPAKSKLANMTRLQVNVISSYGGVMVTQQGSSSTMSGLLTKVLVLDTKLDGKAIGDYESVEKLTGGNLGRGLTSFRDILKKSGKLSSAVKAIQSDAKDISGGKYSISGGSKLSKYY